MKGWVLASFIVACGLPEEGLLVGAPDSSADVAVDVTTPDVVDEETSLPDVPILPDAPPLDAPITGAGWALQFKGNYVDMGNMPIPGDFTLEAWIHPASAGGETYIVAEDERNQSQGEFRFGLADGGKLFFMMSDSGGASHGLYNNGYSLETASAIPLNVWTHVAVAKNGAAFAIAVNGVPAATFVASAAFVHGGSSVNFRVASRVDTNGTASNGTFDGIIDEVRLWSTPRTAAEILQTMYTEIPASNPGLFAYWRFDEGTGLAAGDEKTGYPGTLVSNPTWVKSTAF
jgi:hypothetical protein